MEMEREREGRASGSNLPFSNTATTNTQGRRSQGSAGGDFVPEDELGQAAGGNGNGDGNGAGNAGSGGDMGEARRRRAAAAVGAAGGIGGIAPGNPAGDIGGDVLGAFRGRF